MCWATTGLRSKSGMPIQRHILCVGADRCVRPHGNAPLLWMMDAGQMSNSLCRGGLPRPPAVTTCLSGFQLAREVGASRSCRSRRYTLAPFLSVATLSSPGPRAQHPTSHCVGGLVGCRESGYVDNICVGAGLCAYPRWSFGHRGVRAGVEACPYRTWSEIWNACSMTNPLRRGGPLCPPARECAVVMDDGCWADVKISV